MARVDEPLIPFEAIREALINAICHRDYIYPGGAIDVAIYDDRVEIWSTGSLPTGVDPEQLLKPHRSVRRNPTISNMFYCAGFIEQWGRGTNTIVDLCLQATLDTPRFLGERADVGVIIPAPVGITRIDAESALLRSLSDRKKEILRLLRVNRRMSFAEIQKQFSAVRWRTLQDDLAYLKQAGQVEVHGRGRAAYWCIMRGIARNSTEKWPQPAKHKPFTRRRAGRGGWCK